MAGRRPSINNPYAWSAAQEKAAILLADGVMTQAEVAAEVKVTRQTVGTWLRQPEYRAHIAALQKEIIAHVKELGIASKEARLIAYNDRWQRLRQLIAARGAEYGTVQEVGEGFQTNPVPGGDTGLLVRQVKVQGHGEDRTTIVEFAADTAVLKAMLDLEKQVAQEMGQFVQRTDLTSGDAPVKAYIAIDVDAV